MTFDQRQLRIFLAIVDQGSVGRAAVALGMNQPTVSRALGDMEQRIDQKLFERHSKGIALTAAGETLLPHARMLLFEMEQAEAALADLRDLRQGHLRIGAVATIARGILPAAIGRLIDEAPGIRVTLLEQPDDQLLSALMARRIDLMIAAALPPDPEIVIVAECRYDDVYAAFCAPDHPLADRPTVTLADAAKERWVMPARGATPRDLFVDTLAAARITTPPEVVVETASLDTMVSIVAATRLLGWLPRPLIAGAEAGGSIHVLPIAELAIRRRFFIYRRARGLLAAAARGLLERLPLIERR